MKKFYTTASPGASGLKTTDELDAAIERAKAECKEKKETRYVVCIVAKVELDSPPTKVTRYDE